MKVIIETYGYVKQIFNLDSGLCESSEFIANDQVEYLDEKGNNLTENLNDDEAEEVYMKLEKCYFGFSMVEPE